MITIKSLTEKVRLRIAAVICCLKNHDFKFIKVLSNNAMLVKCDRCNKTYAVNMELKAGIPYNDEVKIFYENFSNCI